MKTKSTAWQLTRLGLLSTLAALALAGCGGGASTTEQVQQSSGGSTTIVKPTADGDMAKFRDTLWVNIDNASNRCGQCHAPGKAAGSFPFADINDLAGSYNTANQDKYVNRTFPAQSGIVTKVAGGHNCWVSDPNVCATSLTQWITAWVQSSGTTLETVALTAPVSDQAVGGGKFFPSTYPAEYVAVHTLLTTYQCNGCHVPNVTQAQQPYFAVSDVQTSYDAVVSNSKINLITPDQSRLYRRLKDDHHNCGGDCDANAADMLTAITAMTNAIAPTTQEAGTVVSRAVNLYTHGISASSGRRVEDSQIALYDFKDLGGVSHRVVSDTSGYGVAYNLSISGGTYGNDFDWLQSWGLRINSDSVRVSGGSATGTKLTELASSGSYSIEAWVIPANTTQQDANIVGFSFNEAERNFSLTQYEASYRAFNRSVAPLGATVNITDQTKGAPELEAAKLLSTLQHVVVTYSAAAGRRIYVDGVYTGDTDPLSGSSLSNWDSSFGLVMGKEDSNATPWLGVIRKVAIHKRALSGDEIQQNFAAGVGQKYLLMFDVSAVSGVPDSFIYMQVQEYDDFSYLFYKPTYINLRDPNAVASDAVGLRLRGMHIGINGREASIGQAFGGIDSTINTTDYIPGAGQDSGQVLSYVGTVIPKDIDGQSDMFFLSFEEIGPSTATKNYNPQLVGAQLDPPPTNPAVVSNVMIRGFEEINATLSTYTGIDRTTASIGGTTGTYTTIYQQLPPTEGIDGFLASHQMAVTQLAIQYCSVLADDTSKRGSYFAGVNFSGMNFSTDAAKDAVISPLLVKVLNEGENLTDAASVNRQPDSAAVRTELRSLIGTLASSCGGTCTADRTTKIVKATCAAAIAGAPMLLQ